MGPIRGGGKVRSPGNLGRFMYWMINFPTLEVRVPAFVGMHAEGPSGSEKRGFSRLIDACVGRKEGTWFDEGKVVCLAK